MTLESAYVRCDCRDHVRRQHSRKHANRIRYGEDHAGELATDVVEGNKIA